MLSTMFGRTTHITAASLHNKGPILPSNHPPWKPYQTRLFHLPDHKVVNVTVHSIQNHPFVHFRYIPSFYYSYDAFTAGFCRPRPLCHFQQPQIATISASGRAPRQYYRASATRLRDQETLARPTWVSPEFRRGFLLLRLYKDAVTRACVDTIERHICTAMCSHGFGLLSL